MSHAMAAVSALDRAAKVAIPILASVYSDYYQIGRGYGNLLAFGAFNLDARGKLKLFRRGRIMNGARIVKSINLKQITEQVSHGWYSNGTTKLNPASGRTEPVYPKSGAYSWLKSPRYQNQPYEVGALARMWINSDYRHGISVMDRHLARAYEARKIARAMRQWLSQVAVNGRVYTAPRMPAAATTVGPTEAPRGALGHWLKIAGGKIANYQVITPSCWNCSPRDDRGQLGPLENALLNISVNDPAKPIEVLRVLHSFDPCLDCAVHVAMPKTDADINTFSELENSGEEMESSYLA